MKAHQPFVEDTYIVGGVRTPFLKAKGVPGVFSASDLAVNAWKGLFTELAFSTAQLDEVIMGCMGPGEAEANIARLVALRAHCAFGVPAWTVQRNCASGLQAIDAAFRNISMGSSHLVVVGGCEAMSRMPLLFRLNMLKWLGNFTKAKGMNKAKALLQFRPQFLVPIISLLKGLTDPFVNLSMGQTAEELAYRFQISRAQMDAFAAASHRKALQAQAEGQLEEVVPIYSWDGQVFEQDDGVRADCSAEKLGTLKPVFDKFGNITPGNSSQITDGAALLVLASASAVKKHRLPVLAKIVDVRWAGLDPTIMGLGPVHAMASLLRENRLTMDEVDHVEINEAFAAQVLACVKAWNTKDYLNAIGFNENLGTLDMEKLNPQGGAIALGHPVGASGARLVLHCAKMMEKQNNRYAVASLCIGGGQGGAILIERA